MSKSYLPSGLINSNYKYTISNNIITVHTNNNCYSQYNTTYCDCVQVYPQLDYLQSETYTCSYNPTTFLGSGTFTSDVWYRLDLAYILIIFLILFIFIFKYPYRIISRLFGRWLKL